MGKILTDAGLLVPSSLISVALELPRKVFQPRRKGVDGGESAAMERSQPVGVVVIQGVLPASPPPRSRTYRRRPPGSTADMGCFGGRKVCC